MKNLFIDYRTTEAEKASLLKFGYNLIICPPSEKLYEAVCGHPDMLLHIIDNNVILHKDISIEFYNLVSNLGENVLLSHQPLTPKYPYDIILNAVSTSNLFVHYTNYSDAALINIALSRGKKLISVKQGYTKCSTAIISKNAIITSDTGIAAAFKIQGFDVLLLPPGDIELPGLNYGFIGGTCGLIEEHLLAFYGSLEYYTYGRDVLTFLKKHKVEPLFLRKGKLIDRGSILTLDT